MGKMTVTGGDFHYPPLDTTVRLAVNPRAVRFTARWKDGMLHVTSPAHVTPKEILKALDSMAPRLRLKTPALSYKIGDTFQFPDYEISINRSMRKKSRITATIGSDKATILIGDDVNISQATVAISRMMCRIAARIAPRLLLPRAKSLAAGAGMSPDGWSISSGKHILGHCNTKRHIALSSVLVFLPVDLRDYIVWHELAHLTEMNHSPRFHAICDRYCGGREKELRHRLLQHNWPILR